MYSYVKSQVLLRTIGSTYENVNLLGVTLYDIFNTYREVFIELSHPATTDPIYMDFLQVDKSGLNILLTFSEWLVENGDQSVPTVASLPSALIKFIRYQDAIQSGYKFVIAKAGRYDLNALPMHDKTNFPDIQITRPRQNTDITLLHTRAIVTINGYLHLTDTDGTHLWVLGATKSMLASSKNSVGILSFMDIGAIVKRRILAADVGKDENYRLYDKLYLTIPDCADKSVILSIFGYMQLEEAGVFYRVGENTFALHISRLPYIERIYEASRYGASDYLNLVKDPANPSVINVDELLSDALITTVMTAINSFVSIIPAAYIHKRKVFLRQSKIPGSLLVDIEPTFPLIVGYGKIGEYWKRRYRNVWVMNVDDNYYNNLLMSYLPDRELGIVNGSRPPEDTYGLSHGFMLELGC